MDSLYCFKDQCEMAEIKLKKLMKSAMDNDVSPSKASKAYNDGVYDSHILGKGNS